MSDLSEREVRRAIAHLKRCAKELHTRFTPFGPRPLAERLIASVDCLDHVLSKCLHEAIGQVQPGGTQADVDLEAADQAKRLVSNVCSDLHSLYLQYLIPPNDGSFPVELLVALRDELCAMSGIPAARIVFCLSEKTEYNNECALLADPVHMVGGVFQDAPHVLPPEVLQDVQAGPRVVIVISYPMAEGRHALLQPVLLHEIAHLADFRIGLASTIHEDLLSPTLLSMLQSQGLQIDEDHEEDTELFVSCNTFLLNWARELCADLLATFRFGPSALLAHRDLSTRRSLLFRCTQSHPDSILRLLFMLRLLEDMDFVRQDTPEAQSRPVPPFEKWLLSLRQEISAAPAEQLLWDDARLRIVRNIIVSSQEEIVSRVRESSKDQQYRLPDNLEHLVTRLRNGIPPDSSSGRLASLGDIFNVGWLTYLRHGDQVFQCISPQTHDEVDRCYESLNELLLKGIEDSYLLSQAKSSAIDPLLTLDAAAIPEAAIVAADSVAVFRQAIADEKLVLTPLLSRSQVGEASVNVRLGSHFLVPKAADVPSFRATSLDEEVIRRTQAYMVRALGDEVVLHPHQLILGHTLEYISLPSDMAGMVLSRSRYGRLGLVVATATFVHPGWKGCLTLELANYGQVPIHLQCGTPIAQMVFFRSPPITLGGKCPKDRAPFPIRPVLTPITKSQDEEFLGQLLRALGG